MKKKLGIVLSLILLFALVASMVSFAAEEEIRSADCVKGTIKVDGEFEPLWENAKVIITDRYQGDKVDTYSEVRTMWDENYLYVFAKVYDKVLNAAEDAKPHEQDSVEFFVDGKAERSEKYDENDAQYRVNYKGVITGGTNFDEKNFKAVAKITNFGYVVEASITMESLGIKGTVKVGDKIGFDTSFNDDRGNGVREGLAFWSCTNNKAWKDPRQFGILKLVAAPAPKASETKPAETKTETKSSQNAGNTTSAGSNPKTSDYFPIALYVAGAAASIACAKTIIKKKA